MRPYDYRCRKCTDESISDKPMRRAKCAYTRRTLRRCVTSQDDGAGVLQVTYLTLRGFRQL